MSLITPLSIDWLSLYSYHLITSWNVIIGKQVASTISQSHLMRHYRHFQHSPQWPHKAHGGEGRWLLGRECADRVLAAVSGTYRRWWRCRGRARRRRAAAAAAAPPRTATRTSPGTPRRSTADTRGPLANVTRTRFLNWILNNRLIYIIVDYIWRIGP